MRALKWGLAWAALAAVALAWVRMDESLWPDGAIPMYLLLGDTPTSDGLTRNSTVEMALQEWNAHMGRVHFVAVPHNWGPGNWPPDPQRGDGLNFVFVSQTIYGRSFGENVLAVTLINVENGRRVESDVLFNMSRSWDSYRGNWQYVRADLRRVALHEFGHVLGLDHPDEAGQSVAAIMNSHAGNLDALSTDDSDGAAALYGFGVANWPPPPAIMTHPESIVVEEGLPATLRVLVQPDPRGGELFYQWYLDGVPIPGGTKAEHTISEAAFLHAGSYTVTVTNIGGTVTSRAAVVTVVAPRPPLVLTTMVSPVIRRLGQSLQLSFGYGGTTPYSYQWYKDGAVLPGATGPSLLLDKITDRDSGSYYVAVSNRAGVTFSPLVRLELWPELLPERFATQYWISRFPERTSLSVSVNSLRSAGPSYQWYHDGKLITGPDGPGFHIEDVQREHSGEYYAVITNEAGSVYSKTTYVDIEESLVSSGSRPPFVAAEWGHLVYFALAEPARLERFDLAAKNWRPSTILEHTPNALAVDASGVYLASGRWIHQYSLDGETELRKIDAGFEVQSLQVGGGFLYAHGIAQGYLSRMVSFRISDLALVREGELPKGFGAGLAIDSRGERIYVVAPDISIYALELAAGGWAELDDPIRDEFSGRWRLFLSPDETRVITSQGIVYEAPSLKFLGSVGMGVSDLKFTSEGVVVLKTSQLHLYSHEHPRELGRHSLGGVFQHLAVWDGHVYAFSDREAVGHLQPPQVALGEIRTSSPSREVPRTPRTVIDRVMLDKDETLYLYSKVDRALHRWSREEQRYLEAIPLRGAPNQVVYMSKWHRIILGYADGHISQIRLAEAPVREEPFLEGPRGQALLIDAGNSLVLTAGSVAYTVSPDGQFLDRSDRITHSEEHAWDERNGRLYFFHDRTPFNLWALEVRPDGRFGERLENPAFNSFNQYLNLPIRLTPNPEVVFVTDGGYYAPSHQQLPPRLPHAVDDAVWIKGELITGSSTLAGTQIQRWNAATADRKESLTLAGRLLRMFPLTGDCLLVVTSRGPHVDVTVLAADFKIESRDAAFSPDRLANLSTLGRAGSGGEVMSAGFVVGGEGDKRLLLRAVGPTLRRFNVTGVLEDPRLILRNGAGETLAVADDWGAGADVALLRNMATAAGAFDLDEGSTDAAMVVNLSPGPYTAEVLGKGEDRGTVLVELYDLDTRESSTRLRNLSTLARADEGSDVIVPGLVVEGDTAKRYLVRAIGPTLATDFQVGGAMPDPRLIVRAADGRMMAENDNWSNQSYAEEVAILGDEVGAFALPAGSKDAATVVTLPPGIYTVGVAAVGGGGVALVEVYEVP